jgi:hypothetical protein
MEGRLFQAYSLEAYSDAELGRLVRQALNSSKSQNQAGTRARRAFAAASRLAGFGWLDDALELAVIAWETTKDLWRRIFRR